MIEKKKLRSHSNNRIEKQSQSKQKSYFKTNKIASTIPKKKKKIISLPRSNIFLNKCYQNKPILLNLPEITSTRAEIKGKHRCVDGIIFISCYWRCHQCDGGKEM